MMGPYYLWNACYLPHQPCNKNRKSETKHGKYETKGIFIALNLLQGLIITFPFDSKSTFPPIPNAFPALACCLLLPAFPATAVFRSIFGKFRTPAVFLCGPSLGSTIIQRE